MGQTIQGCLQMRGGVPGLSLSNTTRFIMFYFIRTYVLRHFYELKSVDHVT